MSSEGCNFGEGSTVVSKDSEEVNQSSLQIHSHITAVRSKNLVPKGILILTNYNGF